MTISLGVAGALGPSVIARIAEAAETAGFHALWVNDTPGGDALAGLEAAAAASDRLVLASGVVPVDRRSAVEIADAVEGVPQHRLVLGIGSGGARTGALAMMRDAVETLRERTSARVVLGALGPRMRRLGAATADGILLNWLTPDAAADQAAEAHAEAPRAAVALYVRTALDPAGISRLEEEADRYASFPNYAANFERLGIAARDTVIRSREELERLLPRYAAAVDEVVLRAITPADGIDDVRAFIAAAAPVLSASGGVGGGA